MGMESFRIDFYWQSNSEMREILYELEKNFKVEQNYTIVKRLFSAKKIYIRNEYRIQNFIVAYFSEKEKYFCLEACLSNFDKYLFYMYEIYSLLSDKFNAKILMNDFKIENKIDYSEFKKKIEDFYADKKSEFQLKYNIENVDIMPNDEFYLKIKK